DARFVAGLIGGDVAGHAAVSWVYMGGIEGGVELYIVDRLYMTLGIGWVHTTYHGVDLAYAKAHPEDDQHYIDFGSASFPFKVGLGLGATSAPRRRSDGATRRGGAARWR